MSIKENYFKKIEEHFPVIIKSLEVDIKSPDLSGPEKVQKYLDLARLRGAWDLYMRFRKNNYLNYDDIGELPYDRCPNCHTWIRRK